jgi:predicted transcriptional regulator
MTTTAVCGVIPGHLAHTTVQTILTRLADKGAVTREHVGRAHAYSPVLNEAGLAARRMRAVLDQGADRAAVLAQFVEALTPEDESTVTRALHRTGTVHAADSDVD